MFGKQAHDISDEKLDALARLVVRSAASADEGEAEAVAASPFLYARIRARVAERREQPDEGWRTLLAVAWRAVPAMAVVAALAFAILLWLGVSGVRTNAQFSDEALVGAQGNGPVSVVLSEGDQLSRDDVFELVVNREVSGAK
ncbi:MAG: hypothetical protein ACJ741_13710 [Pyrinomonadaceae bacterium]